MVTVHQGDLEFFGEERISQIAWWRYKFLQGVLGSLVVTKTFLEVKLVDLEFQSCFQVILKKLPDCPFHLNFLLTANLQPGCDMTKKSLGWQGLQMHGNSVQIFRSCCSFGMKVKRLFRQFPQQPWKLILWRDHSHNDNRSTNGGINFSVSLAFNYRGGEHEAWNRHLNDL